jgi:rRNA-processing protein FCF1
MRILLDTNFLIDLIRFKIDFEEIYDLVLEKYELFTLTSIVNELYHISDGKTKESGYAKVILQLIRQGRIKVLKIDGEADKILLNLASPSTIIATDDMKLKQMLKKKKTKTIYIKSRKHLGID